MAFNNNYPIHGRGPLEHKTGVSRDMFVRMVGRLYNKTTDREYLKTLGLTQEEINSIVVEPQGTTGKRYTDFAYKKNRKL